MLKCNPNPTQTLRPQKLASGNWQTGIWQTNHLPPTPNYRRFTSTSSTPPTKLLPGIATPPIS
jgi:hypothetical protein